MEKKNFKSAIIDTMLMVAIVIGVSSCGDANKPEDTKEVAEEQNEEKIDDRKGENDAQFLVDAAEMNLMEIHLGNLAMQKGATSDVKDMGRMMVDAHTKSQTELTGLAANKAITVPASLTDEGMNEHKKLADETTGKDFDKDYCDKMVSAHKDAIDKFEKAAEKSADPDIKAWATASLPTLRTHLEHAIACQDKIKKM